MSTQYRLLNVGEKIPEGAEHYAPQGDGWESSPIAGEFLDSINLPHRVPLEGPDARWVPMSERKPTKGDAGDGEWVAYYFPDRGVDHFNWHSHYVSEATHWLEIYRTPEPPRCTAAVDYGLDYYQCEHAEGHEGHHRNSLAPTSKIYGGIEWTN